MLGASAKREPRCHSVSAASPSYRSLPAPAPRTQIARAPRDLQPNPPSPDRARRPTRAARRICSRRNESWLPPGLSTLPHGHSGLRRRSWNAYSSTPTERSARWRLSQPRAAPAPLILSSWGRPPPAIMSLPLNHHYKSGGGAAFASEVSPQNSEARGGRLDNSFAFLLRLKMQGASAPREPRSPLPSGANAS